MCFEDNVKLLVEYIESLNDFNIVEPDILVPYNHMGATITDAMLQAGTTWETVVRPRIKNLLKYQDGKTTTGFQKLLETEGINKLLNWRDDEKPARILGVVSFFKENGIETEEDLKTWLENDDNLKKIKKLRGIGDKTADYFKILSGISTSAVDRHLIEFLNKAGIAIRINEYLEAQKIINKAAERMGIKKSLLDHSIWKYMSTKGKKRPCATSWDNTRSFIEWFWSEFRRIPHLTNFSDGLCQCESEHFIDSADRPELMRSFLLLAVLIDQMMYTHFQSIYQEFRSHFCFPKLYSHPESGNKMASPGWFVYSYHGFDKKMNWTNALPVAHAILGDLFKWLNNFRTGDELVQKFKSLMEMEIKTEFEPESAKRIFEVISQAVIRDGLQK